MRQGCAHVTNAVQLALARHAEVIIMSHAPAPPSGACCELLMHVSQASPGVGAAGVAAHAVIAHGVAQPPVALHAHVSSALRNAV